MFFYIKLKVSGEILRGADVNSEKESKSGAESEQKAKERARSTLAPDVNEALSW